MNLQPWEDHYDELPEDEKAEYKDVSAAFISYVSENIEDIMMDLRLEQNE